MRKKIAIKSAIRRNDGGMRWKPKRLQALFFNVERGRLHQSWDVRLQWRNTQHIENGRWKTFLFLVLIFDATPFTRISLKPSSNHFSYFSEEIVGQLLMEKLRHAHQMQTQMIHT